MKYFYRKHMILQENFWCKCSTVFCQVTHCWRTTANKQIWCIVGRFNHSFEDRMRCGGASPPLPENFLNIFIKIARFILQFRKLSWGQGSSGLHLTAPMTAVVPSPPPKKKKKAAPFKILGEGKLTFFGRSLIFINLQFLCCSSFHIVTPCIICTSVIWLK